jgi:hypothetical protein
MRMGILKMSIPYERRKLALFTIILLFCFQVFPSVAQDKKSDKKSEQEKEQKKQEELATGTPVLWQEPDDLESRDLYYGPGGREMMPDTRRITLIEKEKKGWSQKYRVRDGRGKEWVAKIGPEAQSETAAVRLLWAIGYPTEINYLVPRVNIPGAGNFKNVRFEARPKSVKRVGEWKWAENPFVNTREFQGLKTMMMVINNWDTKDVNNVIIYDKATNELRYTISDLGATFGKTANVPFFWRIARSRNKPKDFAEAKLLDKVEDGKLDFALKEKNSGLFDDITIEQARWLGNLLARLSDKQLRDAFRAANYSPDEIRMLMGGLKYRINELVTLPHEPATAAR